jgi:dTDP-glucose pyrophosphorylase/predicted transcriptional regulator
MDKIKLESLLIPPGITIKQAMQNLNDTQERILFVVDRDNKLLGTVNDGDIRRGIIDGSKFNDKVKKVMQQNFISVVLEPEMIERAQQLMTSTKIQQIPVLDDKGIIIDVILWTDILKEKEQQIPAKVHSNQIVIMAGGKGTRLDPFTKILPKPLIPVGNKPVIELIMEKFYKYGFHKFIFTLNYKKEYIKLFLKENNFPYSLDWVEEDNFLGTAGSLSLLKDKVTDTFFVTNCDSLMDTNFENILEWHKEQKASITIVGCHNEFKIPFGVLELSNGQLDKISEKPTHDFIINTGVYVIEPHVISYIPKENPFNMNELIDLVVKREKITVFPIYGGWFDIGQLESYNKTLEYLRKYE